MRNIAMYGCDRLKMLKSKDICVAFELNGFYWDVYEVRADGWFFVGNLEPKNRESNKALFARALERFGR